MHLKNENWEWMSSMGLMGEIGLIGKRSTGSGLTSRGKLVNTPCRDAQHNVPCWDFPRVRKYDFPEVSVSNFLRSNRSSQVQAGKAGVLGAGGVLSLNTKN